MDRTAVIVIALCVGIFGFWLFEQHKYAEQLQNYYATNVVAQAQSPTNATTTATAGSTYSVPSSTVVTPPVFNPNAPEQLLVVSNQLARYTFTSHGGGIKLVELSNYPDTISARWATKDNRGSNGIVTLNTSAPTPVMAVLGDSTLIGDGNFTLSPIANGVRAEKMLTGGLRLVKDFQISSNYLVNVDVHWENISGQTVTVPSQEYVIGTSTPIDADDNGFYQGVMWYNGTSAADTLLSWFSGSGFMCIKGSPRPEYTAGATNVVWAAAHNQFFAIMAMPKEPAQSLVARKINLPQFSQVGSVTNAALALPNGIQTALVYPAKTLTANTAVDQQITLYTGPKEYRTLAIMGDQFQNHADDLMGFNGFLGFCAKPLLLAMNWLHDITKLGYGLVIVLITVIIRVIFWPLTAASTRSMKRMQALQPEMAALKEKYKDDLQKFSQKQWELYKKHKVNPMSGCLPMLIQTPVFIGFFTMLRSAIELRGAHFLWAADLSKPDTLFIIHGLSLPIIGTPEGLPFNLLPLLMGGAMLWQAHLTPPSPGMDESQQKLMRYLPLIFILFFYQYSAGLSLYWTVSNLLSILQTKLTKNLKDPALAVTTVTPTKKK